MESSDQSLESEAAPSSVDALHPIGLTPSRRGTDHRIKVANTNRYRYIDCAGLPACTLGCADDIEQRILTEGPESVAAVFLKPMQNAGGGFTPAPGYFDRVREICDRHGVLLVSDEVIFAFGRLGHRGLERHAPSAPCHPERR